MDEILRGSCRSISCFESKRDIYKERQYYERQNGTLVKI